MLKRLRQVEDIKSLSKMLRHMRLDMETKDFYHIDLAQTILSILNKNVKSFEDFLTDEERRL